MFDIFELLAAFAYQFGVSGAGMPSIRGNHEVPVPEELMECEEEK